MLRMICTDESLANGPGYLAAGESYRLGRSSSCSFVVTDLSVSRYHAEVTATELRILVKDLGSRNGTYVDGQRVQEAEVEPGQSVRFGNAQFQVICHDQPEVIEQDNSELSTYIVPAPPAPPAVEQLSEAQKRVLDLLLQGRSEKEVACRLEISQHTVHNHVKEIYRRMEVNSRPELLALFVAEVRKPAKRR